LKSQNVPAGTVKSSETLQQRLGERFEESSAAQKALEQAWRSKHAFGSAALRDGRVVGYVVGAPREAERWGENVWVELEGHAVSTRGFALASASSRHTAIGRYRRG
jgi:hypothetical protein